MVVLRTFDEVLALLEARGDGSELSSTLASALAHCAQSIEYGCTGFPVARSWLFRATVGRIAKAKFLRDGSMRHDVDAPIPGAPSTAGVAGSAALPRLRRAIAAFRAHEGELAPHFAYGPLSRKEAEQLQAMHVADHVSRFDRA